MLERRLFGLARANSLVMFGACYFTPRATAGLSGYASGAQAADNDVSLMAAIDDMS